MVADDHSLTVIRAAGLPSTPLDEQKADALKRRRVSSDERLVTATGGESSLSDGPDEKTSSLSPAAELVVTSDTFAAIQLIRGSCLDAFEKGGMFAPCPLILQHHLCVETPFPRASVTLVVALVMRSHWFAEALGLIDLLVRSPPSVEGTRSSRIVLRWTRQ